MAAENGASGPGEAKKLYVPAEFEGENDNELPLDCDFTWEVKKFSKLVGPKVESPEFSFGSRQQFKWRILLFPRGNQVEDVSIFVDVADADTLPTGWKRNADFLITIVNQKDPKKSIAKEGSHVFNKKERDRGFNQFTDRRLQDLTDSKRGFLKDDTLVLNVHIHLCRDWIEHADTEDNEDKARSSLYDSKKETGFIGMKNQGATCYLNSLIQSLYHLPILRKAVYSIPTESDKSPAESIPLALQRLFYNLHHSNDPVGTSELTRSFGWTSDDALTQHDVQEFCRKLFEKLEIKMKSTAAEGTIERLFRGNLYNFIKCTEVDYESSRTEDFYDISLNVKGCKDIYDSLRKYTEVETLDGDNKYKSDKYGLQPAKKGILFDSFPPILHLHLKRFEYDFERDQYVKVYDKFFFPATINVKEFLSPHANRDVDYTYHLHGVLVHTGTVGAGHYFAFLRPSISPQWYRFDDGTVSKVSAQKAIDDNFGTVGFDKRSGSAYMLIYVQDSHRKSIFAPLTEKDTPVHLENRFNDDKVKEQMRLNALREEEMFTTVHLVHDDAFKHHHAYDLFDDSQLRSLRLKKDSVVSDLPAEVAKFLEKPVESFRLWRWCRRKNGTVRLEEPLDLESDGRKIVSQLIRGKDKSLVLWVEESAAPAGETPSFMPFDSKKDCILSVKLYDPIKAECPFVGFIHAQESEPTPVLFGRVRKLLGLADGAPVSLYEEIRAGMVDQIDEKDTRTLEDGELGHGDILVAQLPLAEDQTVDYPTPIEYFNWVQNRIKITLKKKDDKKDEGITLYVDGDQSYSVGIKPIGKALNWDSAKLRLTPTVIRNGEMTASQALKPTHEKLVRLLKADDILLYELLDRDLEELNSLKELNVSWRDSSLKTVEIIKIHLDRKDKIASVFTALQDPKYEKIVKLEGSRKMRVFSVYGFKIDKTYDMDDIVANITTFYGEGHGIIVEEIPQDEVDATDPEPKAAGQHQKPVFIKVAHSKRFSDAGRFRGTFHGQPFLFMLRPKEKFADTKKRLHARMHVAEEKIAGLQYYLTGVTTQIEAIADDYVLYDHKWEKGLFLAIDWPDGSSLNDTSPGAAVASELRRSNKRRGERAVEIKG